uniref:Uncharacterized protein n=1 Tax=Avena sativa TaxID=4498 RepID=A0ACD5Y4M9_AVESA
MNPRSLESIRKRKTEDDDEMVFFIFPALYSHLMDSRERIKRHSSILYGKKRVRHILDGHVKNCRVAFRMESEIFRWLASYVRNEHLILDSRLKVEEKLAFFLYMISHNASFEDLQLEFEHSGYTFHKYILEFFDIIPILATRFVSPWYIDEPHPKIFYRRSLLSILQGSILFCDNFKIFFSYLLVQSQKIISISFHCRTV